MFQNCLECLFGEVPLSIQKGYSVLLHPEHGCSLPEYRVFAHLCRMGYRVARHSSDLTVTAYERQIRLDQHLDQRNTYSFTTSEPELPRPDLPPKTVVELPENTEISLESSSLVVSVDSSITTEDESKNTSETRSEKQPVQSSVEVIDILDSSDESSSDNSSSDNSDVEIIHESAPNIKNKGRGVEVVDDDNESDVEVIEVLVPKKEIIVETIDSSDSEEEQSSDSGSDKSHDGNWKRKSNKKRSRYQRPAIMNHYRFLSAQEFCVEKSISKKSQQDLDFQSVSVGNNESVNFNENSDDPECGNCSGTEPIVNRATRPKFVVEKSRNEILDLMPSMGGHKGKLLPMSAPDLRLIPENIIPKQPSYTFNVNNLKARVFKPGFRGRFRGFPGSRYNNFNSYNNNSNPVQNFYPNQINSMPSFTPNPALAQMFGSDIHSMARGMMQFASSLLLNLPQNNQTNSLLPFAQQPSQNFDGRTFNYYSQPDFSPRMQHSAFEPRNSRFNNSSYNSFNSGMNRNVQQFPSNNFHPVHNQENPQRSLTPYSRLSDTDFSERNFTPPPRPTNIQRRNSYMSHRVCSRAFRRNRSRQRARLPPIPPRAEDPAYMKPDVPFCKNPILPQVRLDSSIPLRADSDVEMEIVQVIGDGNLTPQKGVGTYMTKRKRRNRRKRMLNKRMCFDTKVKPEIIFLDSPLSNDSSADLIEIINQANDVPCENNTPESNSGQNLEVKQESREDSLEIKTEQTTVTIVKNEQNVSETSVKSENSCDTSVKSEQNESESNSQTEIKTESSSSHSSIIEPIVKSESNISLKSEPNVKLEESNIKNESSHSQDITPVVKPDEVNEVKLENLTDLVSENDIDRTVNATVSQQSKEVSKELTISTSSVIESEVSLSSEIPNNAILQPFVNEMEVEESDEVSRDKSDITASTLTKNMNSEENGISLSNVSSWAEVKKHNIPISNLPESISGKESDSDVENEKDRDEIKPLIRPKHCRTIGNYDLSSN